MDYEKKYKEALEKARQLCAYPTTKSFIRDLQDLFPELAESEDKDEKIRKEIINYFKCQSEEEPTRKEIHDKWIAWLENVPVTIDHEKREGFHLGYRAGLERQDEQKFEMKTAEESLGIDSDTYNKIVDECIFGEQKPEENKGNIGGISPNWSEDDEPQKELAASYLTKFDEKFPILPTLKGKQLADYKNFLNKCQQIFGLRYWGIRPIQAKLFEKLSLLWAAWGAEHLQGLGQTDVDMDDEILWSEDDEEALKQIDASLRVAENYYFSDGFREEVKSLRNWLKSIKDRVQPKQEWSEEEIEPIISDYLCGREHYGGMIGRLCHLKPKQNQTEWSENDKAFLDDILCKLEHDLILNKDEKDWLKSLRPQNTWKPSETDIMILEKVFKGELEPKVFQATLQGILEQLKKLKEE